MSEPFIAEIRIHPYTFAPRNWAWCNGQIMPIMENQALFALIGNTYGGDGRTTMGLPNLKGRAPMHPGRGPGLTSRRLGEPVGSPSVVLTAQQIPKHKHGLDAAKGGAPDHTTPAANRMTHKGYDMETSTKCNVYVIEPDPSSFTQQMSTSAIDTFGGSQGHENRQPFLGMNYCISLSGIFPSRS